jgi:hypothetical protein
LNDIDEALVMIRRPNLERQYGQWIEWTAAAARALLVLMGLTAPVLVANVLAAEPISYRATFIASPPVFVSVGPSEGNHILRFGADQSANVEIEGEKLCSNCSMTMTSYCDFKRSEGLCQGYATLVSPDGQQLIAKYSGAIKIYTGAVSESVESSIFGSWVYVHGTGKFANVKGGGTYRGRQTTADKYVLEWQGEIRVLTERPASK